MGLGKNDMKPFTINAFTTQLLTIATLLLVGCSQTPPPPPSDIPTASPPETNSPTPVPAVPNTVPPTQSSEASSPTVSPALPSATGAIDDQKRIQFQAGATTATVEGTLTAKKVDRYTFEAKAGQSASVSISSPRQDVLLTIVDPQGSPIQRYQSGSSSWSDKLPTDGVYIVDVVATGETSNYTLTVSIQPQ